MDKDKLRYKSKSFRLIISILTVLLPQSIKRYLLNKLLGYSIHSTARIGLSLIYPKHLVMGPNSRIGNLNLCKGVSLLSLGASGIVGNLNWITAVPDEAKAFSEEKDRKPQLKIGKHTAITNRHLIDCCNSVTIGKFSTVAGFRSQILTHAIDLKTSRQRSAPVSIGDYCFVGTNVVFLAGAKLPDKSVLGASACITEPFSDKNMLYAGVPAKPIKKLDAGYAYFNRPEGFVL